MKERYQKIEKLINSSKSRESYLRAKLNVLIPSQIRGLRLKYPMTQKELGEMAGMRQARISALEQIGEAKYNIDTLVRLAAALKVGLSVKFVTFSEVLEWENDFSQDDFIVKKIDEDYEFITPELDYAEYVANYKKQQAKGVDKLAEAIGGTRGNRYDFDDTFQQICTTNIEQPTSRETRDPKYFPKEINQCRF